MNCLSSYTASPRRDDRPIAVVACVDTGFAPLALVLAASMAATASGRRPITLHVMYCGDEAPVLRQLAAFVDGPVSVVLHRTENPFAHLPGQGRFPPITYLRLLIPELLPDCGRALYLDVDTILLDDVGKLFDAPLSGRPLGAVRDLGVWEQRDAPALNGLTDGTVTDYLRAMRPDWQAPHTDYFNSGVLLMDLVQWRRRELWQRLASAAPEFAAHKWPDQDLLNSVLGGEVAWLDPRWNVMIEPILNAGAFLDAPDSVRQGLARQIECPGLVHFSNQARPWIRDDELPFGTRWWDTAKRAKVAQYFERAPVEEVPPPTPVVPPMWRRAINRIIRATSTLLRGYA